MANVVAEVKRINELELEKGIVGTSASWHAKYEKSAWVYVGNLPTNLTEGDVICIMSQFGEIEDLNLVREESTGKSRGFCFCKYEDARSCILAVDNFCGQKVLGRPLRVDHCENYRLPKEILEKEEGQKLQTEGARTDPGHAYHGKELASKYSINEGHDLFSKPCDIDRQELSNDGQKLLKRKPKEDRHRRRKEREERRAAKEEKRRKKRARERRSMVDDESELFESRSRGHKKRRKRDE